MFVKNVLGFEGAVSSWRGGLTDDCLAPFFALCPRTIYEKTRKKNQSLTQPCLYPQLQIHTSCTPHPRFIHAHQADFVMPRQRIVRSGANVPSAHHAADQEEHRPIGRGTVVAVGVGDAHRGRAAMLGICREGEGAVEADGGKVGEGSKGKRAVVS